MKSSTAENRTDHGMNNQAPLSPARALYEELCETEEAGLLDPWAAPRESDDQTPVATVKIERIHAVDRDDHGNSLQPRSALAAIVRLQSTEIERLALENDRLAGRLDAINRVHEVEQKQRRDLEQQLREASARALPPAQAFDVEEVRTAAREGMSAEIKPVLVSILDLLESTLPRTADAVTSAEMEAAPVPPPADLVAEVMSDFHRLPEILTRPLDELTRGSDNTVAAPERRIEHPPAPVAPREPRVRQPRPPRFEAQSSPMPSIFAWTNLFS